MRRPPLRPSFQFLATATDVASATATMSSRPPYRGGRNHQWPRPRAFSSSSNRPYSGVRGQYVTGDSHVRSVRDANLGFRQGDAVTGAFPNQSVYRQSPPPPFHPNPHFRRSPPFDPNQPYRPNHQFRPPQQYGPPQQFWSRPKPLDFRNWEFAKTAPSPNCERFTVVSYNILADYLANEHRSKLYYHIPHHMMEWQWRKRNLVFELGLWSADVMCFQEVDRFQDIEEELKLKGYSGIWKMRTGNPVDGCAIFWRSSRFKLIHEECIEFSKHGLRDNVAQICVLESTCQNSTKDTAALPTSSTGSNKVVICNIHVLYNPKRGEIKLGQVRMLLDRAHAVSKIWNDAPIVLCGDFNCTPKSPLYNFISEQKLDLSGVDRDKVSGQASAQIYAPRSYNPNYYGARPANHLVQGPSMEHGSEAGMKLSDSPLDMQSPNNPESSAENVPLPYNLSQPQCTDTLDVLDTSCANVHFGKDDGAQDVEVNKETKQNAVHVSDGETESAFNVPGDGLKEDASTSYSEGGFPVDILSDEIHGCSPPVSSHPEQANSDATEMGYKEEVEFTSYSNHGLSSGHCDSNDSVKKGSMNSGINKQPYTRDIDTIMEGIDRDYVDPFNSEIPSSKISSQTSFADAIEFSSLGNLGHLPSKPISGVEKDSPSASYQVDISCASTSVDLEVQKSLEILSLPELDESIQEGGNTAEHDSTFISALHSTEDAFPSDFASVPPNSELPASTNAVEDGLSPGLDSETVDVEKSTYDPSLWTPMEMETATGCAECTLLEHPLKLKSTYTEVEDCTTARDPNGEPQVTSYNRCFLGTVDYIWRSEGLQTVRVLAPIPKHAMQWTSGFPTKKWGSDHIALASELAFVNSSDQS